MVQNKDLQAKKISDAFLEYLAETGKDNYLPAVISQLKQTAEREGKQAEIEITSAVMLNNGEINKLRKILEKALGGDYTVKQKIDRRILGGLKIKWRDWNLDMSLRTRLQQLRQILLYG